MPRYRVEPVGHGFGALGGLGEGAGGERVVAVVGQAHRLIVAVAAHLLTMDCLNEKRLFRID